MAKNLQSTPNPFDAPPPSYGAIGASRACAVVAYLLLVTVVFRWCAEAYTLVPSYLVPMICLTILFGLCLGGSVFLRPPDFGWVVGDCCCRNDELTALCALGVFLSAALSISVFMAGLENSFRYEVMMLGPNMTGTAQNLWRMAPRLAPGRQGIYLSNGYVSVERALLYPDGRLCCAPVYMDQDDMFAGGAVVAWAMPFRGDNGTIIPSEVCEVMDPKNYTNNSDWRQLYGRGGLCGVLHAHRPAIRIDDEEALLFQERFQGTRADALNKSYANRTSLPAFIFKRPASLQWDTEWHRLSYMVGAALVALYVAGEAVALLVWVCMGGVDFGSCTQEYEDGSIYRGHFWRRRFHGPGHMRWSDGEEYKGHYKLGSMHGQGVYIHSDGGRFQGQFQDNLRHGHGVFAFADGSLYEGQWNGDRPAGEGTVMYPNGKIIKGLWEGGQQDFIAMARQADLRGVARDIDASPMPPLPEMRAELPRGLPPPPRGHPQGLSGSAGRLPVLPPYAPPPPPPPAAGPPRGMQELPRLPQLPPLPAVDPKRLRAPQPPIGAPNM